MWRDRTKVIAPSKECLAQGSKYFSQIDRGSDGHSGTVWDAQGAVCWRYGTRKDTSARSWRNPFNKPDFVFAKPGTTEEVVIHRDSFVPPVFQILEGTKVLGAVRLVSIFRDQYSIALNGSNKWTFRMPLYTVRFYGESGAGAEMWVLLGASKMEWIILINPGIKEQPLLAALAFIHTEWWNYG